jgi:protoheme IX farnesyltransferase
LLPTTYRDKISAAVTLASTILLIPVGLMPVFYNFGGYIYGFVSVIGGLYFTWQAIGLYKNLDTASAKKLMYASFFYLPLLQLALLFDLIAPK